MSARERSNPYTKAASAAPARVSRRKSARLALFDGKETLTDEAMTILRAYESQQIPDPFKQSYAVTFGAAGPENILPPPYNPYTLMRFPNENNTLRQCIDAMVINIESMGHRLEYVGPEGGDETPEALAEAARLNAILDQPNGEYGLLELRERCRRDKETFGYYFMEICRGTYNGQIVSYYHVPAHTVRLTACDREETPVTIWLNRDGKYTKQKIKRRFRRFIQEIGTRKVYFKEYGDPRLISNKDGKVYDALPDDEYATELRFENLYAPGSPYGMPRWINQLPAIMGSRESELTNLQFFKDNAIPAMAVLVSGGHLTSDSIEEIEEHISAVQGKQSIHRVMVLEAEGAEGAAAPDKNIPSPKLEIKPLIHDRQSDALFQDYDKNNMKKIRSSFRLSPMLLGMSEDVTYATAQASLVVAEGQVFGPERNKVDDLFNFVLLSDKEGKPPQYWWFRSNPPRIADPQTLINALATLDNLGALTPNIAIGIANELFDLNIDAVQEDWGDYPFSMAKALLEKGMLKGLDALIKEVEEKIPADENDLPPDADLTQDQIDAVQEKFVEPLKKLTGAGNVRKSQKRRARIIRNR